MALFTKKRGPVEEAHAGQFAALVEELTMTIEDNIDLRESMHDLERAVEDLGWKPLGTNGFDDNGMTLDAIRTSTSTTRPLLAANPLVKRGVSARIGYIWGEGLTIKGTKTKPVVEKNLRTLFGGTAAAENENAAATDGNVCFQVNRLTQKIERIGLGQIGEFASDPDHPDTIWFIKRVWTTDTVNIETGAREHKRNQLWYPTLDYIDSGNPIPAMIGGVNVEQFGALHVEKFNRQIGWTWGIPDLIPVLFWSKAYKEFLESQYTLVRSLARFAFKAVDARPKGSAATKAAAKLANPVNYDTGTRQRSDAGGIVAMGQGTDLLAINKAGANVDFNAGKPLAAMVAAGLQVPLTTLLAESTAATDEALDMPTVKAAQARQEQWSEAIVRMLKYLGCRNVVVTFPPIQAAPVHRVIQAIVTAASAGILFPEEVRDLIVKALHAYGIDPKNGLPKAGEWKQYVTPAALNPGTTPQKTPNDTGTPGAGDGDRTPAGAQADGDHEQRPSE